MVKIYVEGANLTDRKSPPSLRYEVDNAYSKKEAVNILLESGVKDFSGTLLEKEDLTGVDFSNTYFSNTCFINANLEGADFCGVTWNHGYIHYDQESSCKRTFSNASFWKSNLQKCKFTNSTISGSDFLNANFINARFREDFICTDYKYYQIRTGFASQDFFSVFDEKTNQAIVRTDYFYGDFQDWVRVIDTESSLRFYRGYEGKRDIVYKNIKEWVLSRIKGVENEI